MPYHVCGAQQDNSTVCVPSNGQGDEMYTVGGGESGYIAPDPLDVDVFYAGSYGGLSRGSTAERATSAPSTCGPTTRWGTTRATWPNAFSGRIPIVIAPTDPHTLYATSQHVWKSTNEGQSWAAHQS